MTGAWRCDHLINGDLRNAATTWHTSEAAAVAEETRLHLAGVSRACAWFDSQGAVA
jgi:hypothetical protein